MKQDKELDVVSTSLIDFHNTVEEAAFVSLQKLLAHVLDVTA